MKEEDVVYKTATLKDFQNPIYSGQGPETPKNLYDGVYSDPAAGASTAGEAMYQNTDGSALKTDTNGGGEETLSSGHHYSALEHPYSSIPGQQQIDNGYSCLQHKI